MPPRQEALSIPNLITYFRLLLIPVFVDVYFRGRYGLALGVLILSGASDTLDGWIARRYHLVTDLGKVIDPVADKLTQGTMIFCVAWHVRSMWFLLGLLAFKEIVMGLLGWYTIKKTGFVNSAKWYGKVCTWVLYVSMALMVIFPGLPARYCRIIEMVCVVALATSLAMYSTWYARFLRREKGKKLPESHAAHDVIQSQVSLIMCEAIVVIVLVSAVLFFLFRNDITLDAILRFTPKNLALAALIFLGLFALKSVTVVFYLKLLYLAAGVVFPLPAALAVNFLGTAIELTIPYLEGVVGGRKALTVLLERRPKLKKLRDLRAKNNLVFSVFLRAAGILPADPLSIYMGASGMDYVSCLGGGLIGMAPSIVITTFMGVSAENPGSPTFIISSALFVLTQVGAGVAFAAWGKRAKDGSSQDQKAGA